MDSRKKKVYLNDEFNIMLIEFEEYFMRIISYTRYRICRHDVRKMWAGEQIMNILK